MEAILFKYIITFLCSSFLFLFILSMISLILSKSLWNFSFHSLLVMLILMSISRHISTTFSYPLLYYFIFCIIYLAYYSLFSWMYDSMMFTISSNELFDFELISLTFNSFIFCLTWLLTLIFLFSNLST